MLETIINGFSDIMDFVANFKSAVGAIFTDVDFTILYNWLPNDVVSAVTGILSILFILALFGLLRRILFFVG